MNIHWVGAIDDDWDEVRDELERAFVAAREAARSGMSFVFVVNNDDLLGRRGAGNAMVATGILSAVRTAGLEGVRDGWTANVVAWEGSEAPADSVREWAERMLSSSEVTGALIRIGPGHLGKALP